MAILFQSNPDQWDLRGSLEPGGKVSWLVTRYFDEMKPGMLALFWEARGSQPTAVRGLYGWGITLDEPSPDERGRFRIVIEYVERWIALGDAQRQVPLREQVAAVPADEVLALPSWEQHLLARVAAGTNFLVTQRQAEELSERIVKKRFPGSEFPKAVLLELEGRELDPTQFSGDFIVEGQDG